MGTNGIYSKVYVFANTTQIIELEILPGKVFAAEAGLKYWIDEGIAVETKPCNQRLQVPGAFGKILKWGKLRPENSASLITYFTNSGQSKKRLAFAAPENREILPIDISETNSYFMCSKNAFMCASDNVEISIDRMSRGYDLRNYVLAQKGFIFTNVKEYAMVQIS
ncbi:MAG: AIM24 family protein [Desulfobacterales bacterium]|nr:MAG: AIM24 family protein [Desulfobacterales bacterium]